jgi:hypothetical protein
MDCKCVFYKVQIQYQQKCRYLAEPKNILAEPGGSAEPRLKNTALGHNVGRYRMIPGYSISLILYDTKFEIHYDLAKFFVGNRLGYGCCCS